MTKSDITLALTMNCHASAYEAVRAYQGNESKLAVFYGEMISMDGIVADDKAFTKLATVEKTGASPKELAELVAKLDLKPGDVVQFQEVSEWARMTMLLHSAVYVGGGLFFEKPNTEGPEKSDPAKYVHQDETPYRLATAENMITPVSNFVEGKIKIDVVRAKAPLTDPHEAFASSMEADVTKWAEKKGRALGVELVLELEQGSGGGIHAEHASALVRTDVKIGADGRGTLAT
jgi:hypothetical protein